MVSDFANQFSVILNFIDPKYRKSHKNRTVNLDFIENNFKEILHIAEKNKVSYLFLREACEKYPTLKSSKQNILQQNDMELKKLNETLSFLHRILSKNNVDFLLIKTVKALPFVTVDVDIAVKTVPLVENILKENGAEEFGGRFIKVLTNLNLGSPGFKIDKLLSVDVYDDIPFSYLKAVDREFLWQNVLKAKINDEEFLVPSPETDLLIIIGSPLFTDRRITYLDFLEIEHLLEIVNMQSIEKQLEKYGWKRQFKEIVEIVKNLRKEIQESECFPVELSFPYRIPDAIMFEALPGPIRATAKACPKSTFNIFSNVFFHCIFGELYVRLIFGI
jgi:hypothetical protein